MVSVPKIPARQADSPQDAPPQARLVDRKLTWVAYVLLLFGGGGILGLHRFYLGYFRSAKIQLALGVTLLVSPFLMGPNILTEVAFYAAFTWYFVDLFLIPKMVREKNALADQPSPSNL